MLLKIAPPAEAPHTIADLRAMPDDGNRYELLVGEIVVTPAPSTRHQWIVGLLHLALAAEMQRANGLVFLAPLDVYLGPHNVMEPDLLVVLPGSAAKVEDEGVYGPPDIVVEVLSPGTRGRDLVK